MSPQTNAELEEARLILRFAAQNLNDSERVAFAAIAEDRELGTVARQLGWNRQRLHQARDIGLAKLRKRMKSLGFNSVHQILSEA